MESANRLDGDDKLGSEVTEHFPYTNNTAHVNISITKVDDLTYPLHFYWENKPHTHSTTDTADFAVLLNQHQNLRSSSTVIFCAFVYGYYL